MISTLEQHFGGDVVHGALAHGLSRHSIATLLGIDDEFVDQLAVGKVRLKRDQSDKLSEATKLTISELALAGISARGKVPASDVDFVRDTAVVLRTLNAAARPTGQPRNSVAASTGHRIDKYLVNLVGEYRVCSELCKRGVLATISYGACKSADVFAISAQQRRVRRIEVKTSQSGKFITRVSAKLNAPDFWVLVSLRGTPILGSPERFYVLSHDELLQIQLQVNQSYALKYQAKHGRAWDFADGVENVREGDVLAFADEWSKIVDALHADDRRPSAG